MRVGRRFGVPCVVLLCALVAAPVSTQTPRFYSDDPIAREPDSRDASGVQPWDIGLMYELSNNLFVTANYKPSNTRARNINTIDEVPDSSWFTNRIGSTEVSASEVARGPEIGPPPAPGTMGDHPRENGGRQPGLHGARCARRNVVSRLRSSQPSRGRHGGGRGRHQAVLGAGLQPGRDVRDDVRSEARGDRSEGDRAEAVRREDAVHARRHAARCSTRSRATPTAPTARPPAACCRERFSAASGTRARDPTIPTTSCRTSIAASCGRCASSGRGPT